MVTAQVPIFMRQHGQKARPIQRHQQRQADTQMVDGTAQEAEPGQLLNAGIELIVERDLVDSRPFDLSANTLQGFKELRSLQRRDLYAGGLLKTHPQGAQAHPQKPQCTEQRPHERDPDPPL